MKNTKRKTATHRQFTWNRFTLNLLFNLLSIGGYKKIEKRNLFDFH